MTLIKHKLAAATAVAAAFSLVAAPAAAVELPRVAGQQALKAGKLEVENRRHRGHRGRDRHDGIDAGDVIAGVLILGGIAAIASAASKPRVAEPYPEPYPYPDDDAYYRAPPVEDRYESGGIGRAVDTCVAEVERGGRRVTGVDSATRDAAGWRVAGEVESGAGFWCTIDNTGQVSGFGGSGTAYAEPAYDAQYDDDYYARARAAADAERY